MLSIICRYLLLLLISSILITTLNEFCQQDVAASPFFGIEEIKDGSNDWTYTDTGKREISTKLNNNMKAPGSTDILAVNYISDGKTLNATLWLSKAIKSDLSFNNNSITTSSYDVAQHLSSRNMSKEVKSCASKLNNSLNCKVIRELTISKDDPFGGKFESVIYGMLIDADSNINTGWNGADYELQYTTRNGMWTSVLFELSSTGGLRELKKESNITDFFGGEVTAPGYVTLSLNLGSIHYPDSYRVLVYTSIGSFITSLDDFSSWFDIPPNQFDVSTLPKPVVLRQGDQEDIPFQLKSPGHSVNRVIKLTEYREDNGFSVSPNSYINPLSLIIKVSPNSSIGVHEIPMIATISTESNASHTADSFFRYKTQGNITVPINLAITVLKPLDINEKFKEFWGIYGQPISIIAGGFAGGMTSLIFDRFKKKKT